MNVEKSEEKESKIDTYYFLSTKTERILFLALMTLISAAPLIFQNGLPAHADWHSHIANAYQFKRCFWQGDFLPRWIDGNLFGYGLPKFNYYAPLFYYIFVFLEIFFRNPVYSMKAALVLILILSTVFGYIYLRRHGSPVAACLATVFVILSPAIHIFTYNNNFPTNALAIPFIFIALYGIDTFDSEKDFDKKAFLITSFGYAGMVLSHLPTAYIFSLMLIPYFLFSLSLYKTKKFVKFFVSSIACGLGLSAFYLFPAITETNLVHTEVLSSGPGWDYSKNFLFTYLDRLPSEGYYWGIFDHRYYEVSNGLFGLVGLIAAVLLLANYDRIKTHLPEYKRVKVVIIMLFISFVMMTPASFFIWSMFKQMQTLQFPWRFTSVLIPFCCVTMVYAFDLISKFKNEKMDISGFKYIIYSLVLLLTLLFYVNFINVFKWEWASPEMFLKHAINVVWQNREYQPNFVDNPNWRQEDFSKDFTPTLSSSDPNADITLLKWTSYDKIFQLFAPLEHQIRIRTFYFPGWNIYVDGRRVDISMDPKTGAMIFKAPSGKHQVEVKFELTSQRKLALIISFVALAIYLFLFSKASATGIGFKLRNIQKPVSIQGAST
jgi:hypothetical protein